MKTLLDDAELVRIFPLHPLLRVLCAIERVERADRGWYGSARQTIQEIYTRENQ